MKNLTEKTLFLDCDSTLCAIEGVDELAALRGADIEQEVIDLTNEAMDGTVPIDEVFARRLDLIQPSREMCEQVGKMYIEKLSPHAQEILTELRAKGWDPVIISGGFSQVIEPVAQVLGITQIHAVDLIFDSNGDYVGFNHDAPTARNGGKPDIIKSLQKDSSPSIKVMVGDGVSDWETTPEVELFIGFGGVVERASVKERANAYIYSFSELPDTLEHYLS